MKFALLSVTYTGLFYKGPALSLEQQIHKAKSLGFDALSIETKRPVASPLDFDKKRCERLRALADREGIQLCALESLSNFAGASMEERENNLAMMRLVLQMAQDLGISLVKLFAAWPGILHEPGSMAEYAPYDRAPYYKQLYTADLIKWQHCLDGIREIAELAAAKGITLALQNHAPVTRAGFEDTLAMVEETGREDLKLCLDVPLFADRQSDAYVDLALERCADRTVLTHFGAWNFYRDPLGVICQGPSPSFDGPINYARFVRGLERRGFSGFYVCEYCLPVLRHHRLGGEEQVDEAVALALEYMRGLRLG